MIAATEIGFDHRIVGLARSPDREGALAHFDPDRGLALVARAYVALTDVIDPTIWVREKLLLATGAAGPGEAETPLKRVLAALRALHAELMVRPESERPWISVMALLHQGGEGLIVSAGDACCLRYRDGRLARLGAQTEEFPLGPPRGALGSESRIHVDVVPLHPEPGDFYLLSTRPLREGEVAVLAADLLHVRDGAATLRALLEGPSDRGRVALYVPGPAGTGSAPEADQVAGVIRGTAEETVTAVAGEAAVEALLEIEEIRPGAGQVTLEAAASSEHWLREMPGAGARASDEAPLLDAEATALGDEGARGAVAAGAEPDAEGPPLVLRRGESGRAAKARRLARVEEDRAWYEPLALWIGGAFAIIALALLVRAILPGLLGSREEGAPAPVVVDVGVVDLFSDPPGATVRVDGRSLEGHTPIAAASLAPGLHRLEFDWGAHGMLRDTVEVVAGEKLVLHPAIHGTISVRSSDPDRVLDVHLDGVYMGTTPLDIDEIVVGRHVVRFGAPGLPGSTQEVDVPRDQRIELVGSAGSAPDAGTVSIRTTVLSDAGFEPGRGDPVWVDGIARGVTPLTLSLPPGTHSVKVVRRNHPAQVSIIDVRSGGEQFVTAEFGARSEVPLLCEPPPTLSRSNPLPVTVTLPEEEGARAYEVRLYAAAPGASFQVKPMTQLEEGSRTYAAVVPSEVLRGNVDQIRVYVRASDASGRELHSEIVTVPVRD